MSEYDLPQRLIVAPTTSFAEVAEVLARPGFRRESVAGAGAPLVRDEPEIAAWSFHGLRPHVFYSFNPVVRLRVLDLAVAPPFLRKPIAEALPTVAPDSLRNLLASPNARDRVLGLWAAQEEERIDLLPAVAALAAADDPLVSSEARGVRDRLARLRDARVEVLTGARLVAEAARPLIATLRDPRAARALAPDAEACARLFTPDIAAEAARLIAREPPDFGRGAEGAATAEDVVAAPAGAFRWRNELSDRFPRGYRNAAGWLQPDRVWVAWRARDGATPIAHDGLVFLGDRWALLPRPWEVVGKLAFRGLSTDPPTRR